jgi:hypothetical protein
MLHAGWPRLDGRRAGKDGSRWMDGFFVDARCIMSMARAAAAHTASWVSRKGGISPPPVPRMRATTGWEIDDACRSEFERNTWRRLRPPGHQTPVARRVDDLRHRRTSSRWTTPGSVRDGRYEHLISSPPPPVIHRPSILAIDIVRKPYHPERNRDWIERRNGSTARTR